MAQQKGQGPAGDGTKGVLAAPTVADQLAAEKAARDRQEQIGWEPAPPRPGNTATKSLSEGQRRDLKSRIKAKLRLAAGKRPE
ncbi:hypothetical protein SEA_INTOLERANT_10 [Streptomyces phage Intolerant]|nr:hypothetical protein SEA_INTOLERANT_10 [Streptomyces phage Intolerant]